jgi:hypothetical protein
LLLLAIGLTILFNLYICPTEVILRLFHGIQFQVKSLIFGLKRNDKKAKSFELLVKASVKMLEGDSLSKIEGEIEKINKEEELKRLEKAEDNKFPCCFEGFMRHKCLLCWCISSIIISLAIATVISIALMAIILMSFGNKEEEICYPIQKKTSSRLLRNQEETNVIGFEKTLQIISQNETHTYIVMPCDSSVINEQGDTFSIEGPYVLNCNESRVFNYLGRENFRISN